MTSNLWMGVILAAGIGSRMRSSTPKPLHTLCGRTLIEQTVRTLREAGIKRFVIVASSLLASDPQLLEIVDGDIGEGVTIAIQTEPRGTGHALLSASDAAVRYWAATGVGNVAAAKSAAVSGTLKIKAREAVTRSLADKSAAVRIASARALCHLERPHKALPEPIDELKTGNQWERLQAAIVLDEIDEQARPVLEQMRAGLQFQQGFNSEGKYRVRVTNRALNELLGTSNTVK